jgi:hypothetical protein
VGFVRVFFFLFFFQILFFIVAYPEYYIYIYPKVGLTLNNISKVEYIFIEKIVLQLIIFYKKNSISRSKFKQCINISIFEIRIDSRMLLTNHNAH